MNPAREIQDTPQYLKKQATRGFQIYRKTFKFTLHCNFTETTNLHGSSSGNLIHICRTPFLKRSSGGWVPNFVLREFFSLWKISVLVFWMMISFTRRIIFICNLVPGTSFAIKKKVKKRTLFINCSGVKLVLLIHCYMPNCQNDQN